MEGINAKELETSMQSRMGPNEAYQALKRAEEAETRNPFLEEDDGKHPTTNNFKTAKLDAQIAQRRIEKHYCYFPKCDELLSGQQKFCKKNKNDPARPKINVTRSTITTKRRTCITSGCEGTFPATSGRKLCANCQDKLTNQKQGILVMPTNKIPSLRECWFCGLPIPKRSGPGPQSAIHDKCHREFLKSQPPSRPCGYRYTPKEKSQILYNINSLKKKGCSQEDACIHEGIHINTYIKWKKELHSTTTVHVATPSQPPSTQKVIPIMLYKCWYCGNEVPSNLRQYGTPPYMHAECREAFDVTRKPSKKVGYKYSQVEKKQKIVDIDLLRERGCSESLACVHEGINPSSYRKWKDSIHLEPVKTTPVSPKAQAIAVSADSKTPGWLEELCTTPPEELKRILATVELVYLPPIERVVKEVIDEKAEAEVVKLVEQQVQLDKKLALLKGITSR